MFSQRIKYALQYYQPDSVLQCMIPGDQYQCGIKDLEVALNGSSNRIVTWFKQCNKIDNFTEH